jgi:hypothetical protein
MPAGWMHTVIDLSTFGMPYLEVHQIKDTPASWLGADHRRQHHEWYNAGRAGIWSLDNPTPTWLLGSIRDIGNDHGTIAAEKFMVELTHDHWDLIWDDTSRNKRRLLEGLFAWLAFRPDILKVKFGVDVMRGQNQRLIHGRIAWVNEPELILAYRKLLAYIKAVLNNDPELQSIVAVYEDQCPNSFDEV